LGDTDEYAHKNDYAAYLGALEQADRFIGQLVVALEALTREGHPSTLLVTTDHGRADNFTDHGGDAPESARGFLMAIGHGVQQRGFLSASEPYVLADVRPAVTRLLGMGPNPESNTLGRLVLTTHSRASNGAVR
jgi:bisphosphoglycerate-independent phosphoglycerate mutase (AlkP superfamily)